VAKLSRNICERICRHVRSDQSLWTEPSFSEYGYSWEQKFEKLIDAFWTILHTIMYARVTTCFPFTYIKPKKNKVWIEKRSKRRKENLFAPKSPSSYVSY
jgi:hypothetical protein